MEENYTWRHQEISVREKRRVDKGQVPKIKLLA